MATIAFAEDEFSQAMVDFAAAMTTRGHRTVRLLADDEAALAREPSRLRWEGLASLCVPGAVDRSGALTPTGWAALTSEHPGDLQAMEPIAVWLSMTGDDTRLGWRKATRVPDRDVIDKLALTRHLAEAGFAVPQTWDSAADLPAVTHVPLLFKLRDSGGGRGVHRCSTAAEARSWADHYGPAEPYLIQEFYPGPSYVAAGVATSGEVVQLMTYANRLDPAKPFAFGYGFTVTADAGLAAYCARIIDYLGISGPFAMDAVRGPDRDVRAVDLNIRVWGSWTGCQAAGLDVLGSYEYSLGLGPHPGPARLRAGAFQPLLRTPPLGVASAGERALWLRRELRQIRTWTSWLGRPWAGLAARRAIGWAVKGAPLPTEPALADERPTRPPLRRRSPPPR